MALKVHPFDPADFLAADEDILAYLQVAMEGNDARHITLALGDVARAKGLTGYTEALSEDSHPTLETLLEVLTALGLELTVQKKAA